MSEYPVPVVSAPEVPATQTLVCANCGTPLGGEYCNHCGQRHEPHVHSVGHFASEAFESVTHADSRLWRTLWFLLAKPGRLTLEFFEGRRVSYLPPFRLYLVISLLFFVVAGTPGPGAGSVTFNDESTAEEIEGLNEAAKTMERDFATTPGAAQAAAAVRAAAASKKAELEGGAAKKDDDNPLVAGLKEDNAFTEFCKVFEKDDPTAGANYDRVRGVCRKSAEDNGKALFDAIVHNIPRAMFIFLPLLALFMKLLYWRPKRYYVEHLLLLVHNHAFVFLALTIIGLLEMIPVVGQHLGLLEFAVWLYIIWYLFRSMRTYYAQSRGLTFAKYVVMGWAEFAAAGVTFVLIAIFSAMTL